MEDRSGERVGERVERDPMTEDQGEVFDCDDGRNEIDGVEEFPRPLAERELRHEIAQGQHPGQEEDGEQDRLVGRISRRSEDEGDRYGRHEPPEKGKILFHGGDCLVQI